MRAMVTGANGFVGRALCDDLARSGSQVVALVRTPASAPAGASAIASCDLCEAGDVGSHLEGVDVVFHLAARVHVRSEGHLDALQAVNVDATRRLAAAAARAGVQRFVFLSSIGVVGDESHQPLAEDAPPRPHNAYTSSKLAAERALTEVVAATGLGSTIIRAPLIIGRDAPGSLATLSALIKNGAPLPLSSIRNRRSVVSLSSLIDFLQLCARHPAAIGQVFHVADTPAMSTPDLVRDLGRQIGRKPMLLPFPVAALQLAARAAGREAAYSGLWKTLEVDSAKARALGFGAPLESRG